MMMKATNYRVTSREQYWNVRKVVFVLFNEKYSYLGVGTIILRKVWYPLNFLNPFKDVDPASEMLGFTNL